MAALSLTLKYPEYTGKPAEVLDHDLGEVAVPAGTEIEIAGQATKDLAAARLESEGRSAALMVDPVDRRRFTGRFVPAAAGTAAIHLEDAEGVPPDRTFRFTVIPVPDRPPSVAAEARAGSDPSSRRRRAFRSRPARPTTTGWWCWESPSRSRGTPRGRGRPRFPRWPSPDPRSKWSRRPGRAPPGQAGGAARPPHYGDRQRRASWTADGRDVAAALRSWWSPRSGCSRSSCGARRRCAVSSRESRRGERRA